MVDRNSKDLHTVLAAADDACYIAKDEGGNRIKIYDTTESLFMQRRGEMQWISRIGKALKENRFILFGQPILPLRDEPGLSQKLEVLLRMIDEEDKMIPPSEFIPAAERYNMMAAIDRWVIRNALEAYSKAFNGNREKGPQVIWTINLSASSLADERFLDYITSQFTEIDVPPSSFCFEITETAAISNMGSATRFIAELKQIGCTFALDDFGNGFSSFNYLKNLQVDYLKIDGSFVKDMDQNRINRAMVEAINDLGHAIKVKTIAEFVTNKTVLDDLKALGVDYGQGYELGKPSPLLEQLSD
jgi:EAL domain-containing protein (putative c-di-GMP-specific phosphodiesterase class I)